MLAASDGELNYLQVKWCSATQDWCSDTQVWCSDAKVQDWGCDTQVEVQDRSSKIEGPQRNSNKMLNEAISIQTGR